MMLHVIQHPIRYLWRSFGGHYPKRDSVDQIARLIDQIERVPNSRRLLVTGWDPRVADQADLPPCRTLFQFKVERGARASLSALSTLGGRLSRRAFQHQFLRAADAHARARLRARSRRVH